MRGGYIYAIRSGDLVKIGWSKDPHQRIADLQTMSSSKCVLLGVKHGTVEQEKKTHKVLAKWREHGEWFHLEGAVSDFVKTLGPYDPNAEIPDPGPKVIPLRRVNKNWSLSEEAKYRLCHARIVALVKLFWPLNAAQKLAEVGDTSVRHAQRILNGEAFYGASSELSSEGISI